MDKLVYKTLRLFWLLDRKILLPITHSSGGGVYTPRPWAKRINIGHFHLIDHPWCLWCGCGDGMETWEELKAGMCENCLFLVEKRKELNGKCGGCRYWNFKVSGGSKVLGQCLNPKATENMNIGLGTAFNDESLKLESWQIPMLYQEVHCYGRFEFEETQFGCIYFEAIE